MDLLRAAAVEFLGVRSNAYQKFWVLTEPLEWIFYVLVVLEIYSLVLEDFQGLATVGRWSLIAAVSVSLLASALSLLAPSHYAAQSRLMAYYYLAERAVYLSLVVFLLTILGLLMQYPIVLRRNIIAHSLVFSIYFLTSTVIYLLLTMAGFRMIAVVRYSIEAVNLGAVGAWLWLLNPAGEAHKQRLRPAWMPGQEEALVGQLNSLNAALLRATRK